MRGEEAAFACSGGINGAVGLREPQADQRTSSSFDVAAGPLHTYTRHVALCMAKQAAHNSRSCQPFRTAKHAMHTPYTREIPIYAPVSSSVIDMAVWLLDQCVV
jgi:hypothetical protein